MKKIIQIFIFFVAFVGFGLANAVAQCPMCKMAVESADPNGGGSIAAGMNAGILYLFAIPYLAIALIGITWYRKYKQKQREEAAAKAQQGE